MHLDVQPVQVQIGMVEVMRHVRLVDLEKGGAGDPLLVSLVFDVFAGILEHVPVVRGRGGMGADASVLRGGEAVDELDVEGLAWLDPHGGAHEGGRRGIGIGVGSAEVGVGGVADGEVHGPDGCREDVVRVAAVARLRAWDVVRSAR